MKYLIKFNEGIINNKPINIPKISEEDVDNIMDMFFMYILDKYKMVEIDKDNILTTIAMGYADKNIGSYCWNIGDEKVYKKRRDGLYPRYQVCTISCFHMEILKPSSWNTKEFNSDMILLKKRLNKFGFYTSGHASDYYGSKYYLTITKTRR